MTPLMLPGVEPRTGGRHRRRGVPRWAAVAATAVLAVAATAVSVARYLSGCRSAGTEHAPVTFTVEPGTAGSTVVRDLHEAGVVRCEAVARWDLRRTGLGGSIRAGTYELETDMAPAGVFAILSSPPPEVPTSRLTIPEGYRLSQIAARVEEDLGIPARRFLRAAEDADWALPPYLPAEATSPEGFLFPDTYDFRTDGTSASDVIERLLAQFATEAATLPWENADALGVSPYEVVVIASMIEEEARVDGDRPLIAAVIYNRLAVGMTLGIDATLQYVDPDPSNGLVASDFEIESPYNTRRSAGLPPTPIASPGLASLRAALEPADVEFLYYVLCGADGSHAFSESFDQFTADKARCLG